MSYKYATLGALHDAPAAPFGGRRGHHFRQRASSVRPILPTFLLSLAFSRTFGFFVEPFLEIALLWALVRHSCMLGGTGAFSWDAPGVLIESSEELLEILRLEWSPSVWSVRTCCYYCYCAVLL